MDSEEVLIICISQYAKSVIFVSSRINLNKFKISKSNKRNLKINEDLKLIKASKEFERDQRYNLF